MGAVLLCLADKYSELGRMVEDNNVGKCFSKDDLDSMAAFVANMATNSTKADEYKMNARNLSLLYTPENAKLYVI